MKRREFIALLGGAAAAWPVAARAQQPSIPVLGFLYAGSPEPSAHLVAAFRAGLSETGYIEGQNVSIEFRWAHNQNERLPDLAADLISRRVAAIVTPGSLLAPIAAKAATDSIPIVFSIGGDPVEVGLVSSFNRPGGNVTGISSMNVELGSKRLGLLHELQPKAGRFAVLAYHTAPRSETCRQGPRPSGRKSKSFTRPPMATSMQLLQACGKSGSTPSCSLRARCSTTIASKLPFWRRAMQYPRFILRASLPQRVG